MLILASQSPRRGEILRRAGIPFVARPANVDESVLPGEDASTYVKRVAQMKARAAAQDHEFVLGADTVVVIDGDILGKPADRQDAAAMLRRLAGRTHQVVTGVCIKAGSQERTSAEYTDVHFTPVTDREIEAYVATGEPMDKAGAYAIQGLASKFIDRIEGCYFNVVGLPVARVYRYLKDLGFPAAGPAVR